MANTIDCPNCGKTLLARNKNGQRRTYCTIECSAAYRPKLAAQRRERQRAAQEYHATALEAWLQARRERLARLERMPAA